MARVFLQIILCLDSYYEIAKWMVQHGGDPVPLCERAALRGDLELMQWTIENCVGFTAEAALGNSVHIAASNSHTNGIHSHTYNIVLLIEPNFFCS